MCVSVVLHHVGFFSGLLYVSNISHGMWKTNKVPMLLIHWLCAVMFLVGLLKESLLWSILGGVLFCMWYMMTVLVWLHFLCENYDRHYDGLSAREQKTLQEESIIEKSWGRLSF